MSTEDEQDKEADRHQHHCAHKLCNAVLATIDRIDEELGEDMALTTVLYGLEMAATVARLECLDAGLPVPAAEHIKGLAEVCGKEVWDMAHDPAVVPPAILSALRQIFGPDVAVVTEIIPDEKSN